MPPDQPAGPSTESTPGGEAAWVDAWIARTWRAWRIESALFALAVSTAVVLVAAGLRVSSLGMGGVGLLALGVALWRLPGLGLVEPVIEAAERRAPALRNALRAWHEAAPGTPPAITRHLAVQVRDALGTAERPRATTMWHWVAVAVVATAGLGLLGAGRSTPTPHADARADATAGASASVVLSWTVTVRPPSYTALATRRLDNPRQVEVIEGTSLALELTGLPVDATLRTGEGALVTTREGTVGRTEWVPRQSDVLLVAAPDGTVLAALAVVVRADGAPRVRITAPATDLRRDAATGAIVIRVTADDDIGLRDLRLRFTRVSGSGESFTFEDGEWPLVVARPAGQTWTGTHTLDLTTLGLGPGDSVVYHAIAHDARPGPEGAAESERFLIEITRRGAQAGGDYSLPEPEQKFALSQRMVIQLTERLLEQRPRMRAAEYREQAQALAVAQRSVRAEFVFMLGGDVEDEFEEAAHSHEVEAGRLDNRGQSDLTEAVRQMSQAERRLTDADLREALPYEYKALAHLQAAFGKARYFMRTLPVPVQIDPGRRLTGDREGLVGAAWRFEPLPVAGRARALQVLARLERDPDPEVPADLLGDIVALDAERGGWVTQVQEARSRGGRVALAGLLRERLTTGGPAWFALPLARTRDESLLEARP